MSWIELFPTVALLFFLWAELEQLKTTFVERTVKGLSLKKYIISLIINCLFSVYYILLSHWVVLIFNIVLGILILIILVLGLKYKRED